MLKQLKISIKQPYVEKCKTIESLVENQLIPGVKKYCQQIVHILAVGSGIFPCNIGKKEVYCHRSV